MKLISWLYTILTTIAAFLLIPFFFLTARGRARCWERFGYWHNRECAGAPSVWIHVASLGEANGIRPFIRTLKRVRPDLPIIATAISASAIPCLKVEANEVHLLPFDSQLFYWIALRSRSIKCLLISETELWPGLIEAASNRNIRVFVINGRISDFTIGRYHFLKPIMASVLQKVSRFFVVNNEAKGRYESLGVSPEKIEIVGNTKHDISPSVPEVERLSKREKFFPSEQPTLVLGSIWPGEDALWLPVLRELEKAGRPLNVAIVPRHTERFDYFEDKLTSFGIAFRKRTMSKHTDSKPLDVLLVDTLGELESIYSFSDLVFIGGSLVEIGGHNPLEAAMYGVPIMMGPSVENVRDVVERLERSGALQAISGVDDAFSFISGWITSPDAYKKKGEASREVWKALRGASEKVLHGLSEVLRT